MSFQIESLYLVLSTTEKNRSVPRHSIGKFQEHSRQTSRGKNIKHTKNQGTEWFQISQHQHWKLKHSEAIAFKIPIKRDF